MVLPEVDGWQFLDRVLPSADFSAPVLVVTAYPISYLYAEWVVGHGRVAFLSKPADPVELLAEVRRCLAG
jgi:CheY-like chemotaxis protein